MKAELRTFRSASQVGPIEGDDGDEDDDEDDGDEETDSEESDSQDEDEMNEEGIEDTVFRHLNNQTQYLEHTNNSLQLLTL